MNAQLEKRERTDRAWLIIITIVTLMLLIGIYFVWDKLHKMDNYIKSANGVKYGVATWYARGLNKDGSKFTGNMYTCASDYFPRYSMLLVKNMVNNKTVVVWVNDTHECTDIMIDLSKRAFREISPLRVGKIVVKITWLGVDKEPNPNIFGKVQI